MTGMRWIPAAVLALCACDSGMDVDVLQGPPPGSDVSTPFPIDRGDDGVATPGSYKGLWLRLVDRGEPEVSPVDGITGVVCIGMSNSQQECSEFLARLQGEWTDAVRPSVRVVNCARGGHAIERWIDPAYDDGLWHACLDRHLPDASVRPDQVRVLYHKAANQFTTAPGGASKPFYPEAGSDYEAFYENLTSFSTRVRAWFPAVQAVYTTSRSYGGFTSRASRGEPLSYEEGHALNRWLEDHPQVDGVWYGWGPYIWAASCDSGVSNARGTCYDRADYREDAVHPSESGRIKISGLIHARFLEHAWYRR